MLLFLIYLLFIFKKHLMNLVKYLTLKIDNLINIICILHKI